MNTDIFSTFAPSTPPTPGAAPAAAAGGDEFAFDNGAQQFNVEGADPMQPQQPTEEQPAGGAAAPKTDDFVQVKKEDWDRTQEMLAEMRGFMTAAKQPQPQPEAQRQPQQPTYEQPPQQYQQQQAQQQQQALQNIVDSVTEDLTSLDPARTKGAVQRLIAVGAQLGAMQAQQIASPGLQQTADLMIEAYITRKSSRDPDAYDKVGQRFENRLAQIDPRVIAGYNRSQLNAALDEMYDAELGRWAREKMAEAKTKQTQPVPARQEPTNYGGGKSATTGGGAPRTQVPDAWKKFALDMGIPEDQITPEMFAGVE